MLVQFSFGNFRSFKETATLSMVAAEGIKVDDELNQANVFAARPQLDLLRVAALYGANASGKSNVGTALSEFLQYLRYSANVGYEFTFLPFLLDTTSKQAPLFFEIIFVKDGVQYRYGFEVKSEDEEKGLPHEIQEEWLFQAKKSSETVLFERHGDKVKLGRQFSEVASLLKEGQMRRKEPLFLSWAAQFGEGTALEVVNFLMEKFRVLTSLEDDHLREYTEDCLKQNRYRDSIIQLINEADTGIPDISILEDEDISSDVTKMLVNLPREEQKNVRDNAMQKLRVAAYHPTFDVDGKQISLQPFPLALFESEGTKKLFAFAGPVFDTLHNGVVLFVDELDASLHPLLTRKLVGLFQSPNTNPKNAQLIFITHDTDLLNTHKFRRDQIWFVEKDRFGASHLFSLSDFKGVDENDAFEAAYFQGRYGGIPFLVNFDKVLMSNGKA